MSEITAFTLKPKQAQLDVELDHNASFSFSYEYLRVFSPTEENKGNQALVTHKKQVAIRKIESVGKQGYRLIFDDGYSAIYTTPEFITLFREYDMRWQHYLSLIAQSPHSREQTIDFKQL